MLIILFFCSITLSDTFPSNKLASQALICSQHGQKLPLQPYVQLLLFFPTLKNPWVNSSWKMCSVWLLQCFTTWRIWMLSSAACPSLYFRVDAISSYYLHLGQLFLTFTLFVWPLKRYNKHNIFILSRILFGFWPPAPFAFHNLATVPSFLFFHRQKLVVF